jgi:phasin family protein
MTTYPFAEFFKQSLDLNQLFATQRRNIEALSAANQAFVEGAQAISRRQAEIVRDHVENVMQASRSMMSGGTPDAASMSKQADIAKQLVENTLSNIREVTEMATKTSFEAFDVLNRRASESLEEISKASGTPNKKKAA